MVLSEPNTLSDGGHWTGQLCDLFLFLPNIFFAQVVNCLTLTSGACTLMQLAKNYLCPLSYAQIAY